MFRVPGVELRVENLTRTYRSHAGKATAFARLSFTVEPGDARCIMGDSGSGKTTLLRTIAGLIEPDRGKIMIDGSDQTTAPPHRRPIGYLAQDAPLWPHLTALANVEEPLRATTPRRPERRRIAINKLEQLGVSELASKKPHQLSGGQRRRVALAQALATDPPLLLCDEPFSGLHQDLAEQIRSLLVTLDCTRLIATHNPTDARALSTEPIRLEIQASTKTDQIPN